MASVDKRRDGRTGYVCRWRDEAGKQRKKSFKRKVDADRYRAEVEHSLNTGAYVDPAAGRQTFEHYAEQWRTSQPHRPNTAMRVRSQLTHHVYPVLGTRPIAAVRPSEVQALVAKLSTSLAPGSVRTVMASVGAVFAAAVRDRAIGRDPCAGVKMPATEQKRIVPLTVSQVQVLVDALPRRYRALAVVMAGTGLRQGEAFGLQLRDIDMLRGVLTVERQVQPAVGGGAEVCPLKNKAAYRVIPFGEVVTVELAAHLQDYPPRGEQFVFTDAGGGALSRTWFNERIWEPTRTAAELPGVGCHDLRHFYASALIAAGLSVKVVSTRLGHSNAAMTLNTYSHLWPDDEDRTRTAIDAIFRADVPRMRPAQGS